jgi:hypothetical protein
LAKCTSTEGRSSAIPSTEMTFASLSLGFRSN